MSDKHVFILSHDLARQRAIEAVRQAPDGYRVTIEVPRRNLEQNAALHARLSEIAERCEWAGHKWDVDTWKRLLTGAWSRANKEPIMMLPALDGQGVEIVFRRTSTMTKAECSDLIDFINAWCSERPEFAEDHV